jgi:hypothetical protein
MPDNSTAAEPDAWGCSAGRVPDWQNEKAQTAAHHSRINLDNRKLLKTRASRAFAHHLNHRTDLYSVAASTVIECRATGWNGSKTVADFQSLPPRRVPCGGLNLYLYWIARAFPLSKIFLETETRAENFLDSEKSSQVENSGGHPIFLAPGYVTPYIRYSKNGVSP